VSGRLRTFSIGFEAKSFDESGYARTVARRIGSEHTEDIVGEQALLDSLDTVIESLDEPLADHSYLPTYLLSRLAARHVKVVLGGDGGDELWGGYPTYKAHQAARLYALVPERIRRGVVAPLVARLPVTTGYQGLDWKIRRFTGRWDDAPLRRHFRWLSSVDLPELARALPFSRGIEPPPLRVEYPVFVGDAMTTILGVDFASYMHASVLTKVDRASMAHGLEVRPPLLDNECIDLAFSLPARFKVRGATTKYLFKRAARPHVSREIVDRPKRGFGIPLIAWLRGPLLPEVDAALGDSVLWDSGVLDRDVFRGYRDAHAAGATDASKPLWALVVLSRWVRRERIGAPDPGRSHRA
jgi:asparagine synthase (glutamine-hydrolysing)